MKQNKMDLVTDELKGRVNLALNEAKLQFKGTNPYRQEKVSNKERLDKYAQFTPEIERTLIQGGVPPQVISNYHLKMQELIRRQRNAVALDETAD